MWEAPSVERAGLAGEGGRLHARGAAPYLLHVQARQHGRLEARGTLDPVPCKTGSFTASHTLCP